MGGIVENTPVEKYKEGGRMVWVKREDMACSPPGPPFSKVRGLFSHMEKLKGSGVRVVGYTETSISMAGWGVAWCAKELGMKAVIFDPQYLHPLDILEGHRDRWRQFGAELMPVKAGRAVVNYYSSRRMLEKEYPGAVMLSLGLPLEETVEETAREFCRTEMIAEVATIVVNVGSGTVCAGLIRGVGDDGIWVIGVMGRKSNLRRKRNFIEKKSGCPLGGLLGGHLELVDPGWQYAEPSKAFCPFPCHRYYDLKAWEWLMEHLSRLKEPVMFWNIGREDDQFDV